MKKMDIYILVKQLLNHEKLSAEGNYDFVINSLMRKHSANIDLIREALDDILQTERSNGVLGERDYTSDILTSERTNEVTEQFNTYKHYLSSKIDQKSILNMSDSISEISTYLGDPKKNIDFKKKGLVFGQVQSGKTAHYIGLMHKVVDLGYQMIVVLTSNDDLLRKQTQERIEKDLIGYNCSAGSVEGENVIGVGKISTHNHNKFNMLTTIESDDINGKINMDRVNVVVLKKNSKVLKNWQSKFKSSDFMLSCSKIVIDDEADWGSVNSAKDEETPKAINSAVREFIKMPKCCYIAYTATPFSNLFASDSDSNGVDVYPEDFIAYIEPGNGYKGFTEYFLTDDDFVNITKVDVQDYADNGETIDRNDIQQSIRDAIMSYFLSIFHNKVVSEKSIPCDMLINISRLTVNHSEIKWIVEKEVDQISSTFDDNLTWFKRYLEWVKEDVQFSFFQNEWNKFLTYFRVLSWKPTIVLVNASKQSSLEVENFEKKRSGLTKENFNCIFIGGNKLSRGLTFEYLSDALFIRNINQYDSSLQMARWFGYHSSRIERINLFTTEEILDDFILVSQAVDELQNTISDLSHEEDGFKKFNMRIKKNSGINPTQKSKMRRAVTELLEMSVYGKTFSEIDYTNYYHNSRLAIVKKVLSENDFEARKWGYLAKGVSWNSVMSLISESNLPNKLLIAEEISKRKINLIVRSNLTDENGSQDLVKVRVNNTQKNNGSNQNVYGYKLKTLHTKTEKETIPAELFDESKNEDVAHIFIYPFIKKIENEGNVKPFLGVVVTFGKTGSRESSEYFVKQ